MNANRKPLGAIVVTAALFCGWYWFFSLEARMFREARNLKTTTEIEAFRVKYNLRQSPFDKYMTGTLGYHHFRILGKAYTREDVMRWSFDEQGRVTGYGRGAHVKVFGLDFPEWF